MFRAADRLEDSNRLTRSERFAEVAQGNVASASPAACMGGGMALGALNQTRVTRAAGGGTVALAL